MSTKIIYQERKPLKSKTSQRLVSYVVEEPIEALRMFYGNKSILNYGGITFQGQTHDGDLVDSDEGLVITKARAPRGTMIITRLEDLRPSKILGADPIFDKVVLRLVVVNAIDRALQTSDGHDMYSHLELYTNDGVIADHNKNKILDERVKAARDIVEVVLGIEKPTVKTLKELLKRK